MFGRSKAAVPVASSEGVGKPDLASASVGETSAKEIVPVREQPVPVVEEVPIIQPGSTTEEGPLVDVRNVAQSLTFAFGGFLTGLLGIDVWYSKKQGILKFTGHTVAHLVFLLVVVLGVLVSIFPGTIL